MNSVYLHIYDLSQGLAKKLSSLLLGKTLFLNYYAILTIIEINKYRRTN